MLYSAMELFAYLGLNINFDSHNMTSQIQCIKGSLAVKLLNCPIIIQRKNLFWKIISCYRSGSGNLWMLLRYYMSWYYHSIQLCLNFSFGTNHRLPHAYEMNHSSHILSLPLSHMHMHVHTHSYTLRWYDLG